ncbi:MAG TPA: hypothetical protein VHU80_03755 [Polyangiaceae bacterium]|jgi:hypothetical protein|nr:hypothetical protein [Polyangiaceae bacterium]
MQANDMQKLGSYATAVLCLAVLAGCQGSTSGSAPPPASATAAVAAPESPPAGPPADTANVEPGVAASGSSNAPDPTRELAAGTVSVQQAIAMSAGSAATVRGLFLGWRGPCQTQPPTRSAWQLADSDQKGAACVYVDGPPPTGLDATGRGTPTWVRVQGTLTGAGTSAFLKAQHAEKETP